MTTQPQWPEQVDRAVDEQSDRMIALRRHMHAHPDPSRHEQATTQHLHELLEDTGLDVRYGPDRRGLIVDSAQDNGKCIGLRGDIDALPIEDAKSTEYCSRVKGVMHACGHDGHTAVVMGAVLALTSLRAADALPWPVQWRAIFQPSEETNEGALEMIQIGAIEGVDALLSLHMDPTRRAGTIGTRCGAFTADCDELLIRIEGRGGHAARPHESLDPIAAAAQLINSIYALVPRAIDSHDPIVVTFGRINGGEHYNVIPDHVDLIGTMRTFGGAVRQKAVEHIERLARAMADASGTTIGVTFNAGPPSVFNGKDLTNLVRHCATDLLGADAVQTIDRPSMGGEDFANYLAHVPGSMFRLGCAGLEGDAAPLHSPMFDMDESALAIGAKILARAAVQWSAPE